MKQSAGNGRIRNMIYMTAMVFSLTACTVPSSQSGARTAMEKERYEIGFDTPEETVTAYLNGMKAADFEQMIGAFALESYVENYNFEAAIARIGAYTGIHNAALPRTDDFVAEMLVEVQRGKAASSILQQYTILADMETDLTTVQRVENKEDAKDFTRQLERALYNMEPDTLNILGFIPPEALSSVYANKQNQDILARIAKVQGADQLQSMAAVFEINGEEYVLCLDVVCYDDKWYIREFSGNIGALLGIAAAQNGILPLDRIDKSIDLEQVMIAAESEK